MDGNRITLDGIVGANIAALRHRMENHGGKKMTQDQLRRELRPYGINWNRQTLISNEAGKRSCRVGELWGLAKVFQVPIDYFFIPTAELADQDVDLGDGNTIPAWMLLADQIAVPEGDPDFNLELRAKMMVVDILRSRGFTAAVKGIQDAIERAMLASAKRLSSIVDRESAGV